MKDLPIITGLSNKHLLLHRGNNVPVPSFVRIPPGGTSSRGKLQPIASSTQTHAPKQIQTSLTLSHQPPLVTQLAFSRASYPFWKAFLGFLPFFKAFLGVPILFVKVFWRDSYPRLKAVFRVSLFKGFFTHPKTKCELRLMSPQE